MRNRLMLPADVPARRPHASDRKANLIDLHVGRRLRLARTLAGLSQRALGEQLNLTFQQVQKYEQGVNRIGAGLLYQFACVLLVPVDFFFDDIPADIRESPPQRILTDTLPDSWELGPDGNGVFDREVLEIVRAFQAIGSVKLRQQVRILADALSGQPPRRRRNGGPRD